MTSSLKDFRASRLADSSCSKKSPSVMAIRMPYAQRQTACFMNADKHTYPQTHTPDLFKYYTFYEIRKRKWHNNVYD